MKATQTKIPGCIHFQLGRFEDSRGTFVKAFSYSRYREFGLATEFKEDFYTVSKKNVLRGLHFQLPPHDHHKVVTCQSGRIYDVIVDLRRASPMYGKYISFELTGNDGDMIYIPAGCAHGFLALEDDSMVCYKVTSEYNKEADSGIHFDSVGVAWPRADSLIVSDRDRDLRPFSQFNSPF
jgi:dTDP-4-dehydrorhamnose 3,5-epimerase